MDTLSSLELTRLSFAILILLGSTLFFGFIFHRLKMPKVIGEIVGGIILGPTFLGYFFPGIYKWIFHAFQSESEVISLFYWLGLLLLMLISGFEIENTYDKKDRKIIIALLLGSTLIPFFAGWIVPDVYGFSDFLGPNGNIPSLKILVGVFIAVTSIPVISRIFIDLGIINTRFAKIILITATIHDFLLWIVMDIAFKVAHSESISVLNIIYTVLTALAFCAISFYIMAMLFKKIHGTGGVMAGKISQTGFCLALCISLIWIASLLSINIIFAAFVAGIIVNNTAMKDKFRGAKKRIKKVSLTFLVPIYFGVVGLKLDLIHHFDPVFFLSLLLFSTICAGMGTFIAAKMVIKDWRSCCNFAVAMNARGGPGIIIASVAFDLKLIDDTLFVTFVLIAIITSLMAGFWFRMLQLKKRDMLRE